MESYRNFKVLDKQVKYENPWMRVVEFTTETDGKAGLYGVIERANSAVIIIETSDEKVLFVKQYRFPTDEYSWELPMGGLDANESPQAAAIRELEEETGVYAEVKKIGEFRPVPGLTPQRASVFYGRIPDSEVKCLSSFDERVDEITERQFISKDAIKKMIAEQKISDGFTLSSLAIWNWR